MEPEMIAKTLLVAMGGFTVIYKMGDSPPAGFIE